MNNELERIWKEAVMILSRHAPVGTEASHKTLTQNTWCAGRDSNRALPENDSTALPLGQPLWRSDIRLGNNSNGLYSWYMRVSPENIQISMTFSSYSGTISWKYNF
jgi:hypothetical protein